MSGTVLTSLSKAIFSNVPSLSKQFSVMCEFQILPVIPCSKSLMYSKNKIGPSTDRCGTPANIDFQIETSPSTTTLCLLSVSNYSIQLINNQLLTSSDGMGNSIIYSFTYHVMLTGVLVFDVELYQNAF